MKMRTEKQIYDTILNFAKADDRIRVVTLEGSRTNINIIPIITLYKCVHNSTIAIITPIMAPKYLVIKSFILSIETSLLLLHY